MPADVLAFGAHPDDLELSVGGILVRLVKNGRRVVLVDLTRGELASGGDPVTRFHEANEAAKIMGVEREILDLGDCQLTDNFNNRLVLVERIRQHRPQIVLAPYPYGFQGAQGHPDHRAAGTLATHSVRMARFKNVLPHMAKHEVKALFYYGLPRELEPTFVLDITDVYEQWMGSVKAYRSQFMNPERPFNYLEFIERLARGWGMLAGCRYGQPLLAAGPLRIEDIFSLLLK